MTFQNGKGRESKKSGRDSPSGIQLYFVNEFLNIMIYNTFLKADGIIWSFFSNLEQLILKRVVQCFFSKFDFKNQTFLNEIEKLHSMVCQIL